MYQESGEILEHERLCEDIYRIKVASRNISREASPGQFLMLKVSSGLDPLLRRPFSFHEAHDDSFELLYKVVGRGTSVLSGRRPGELVDSIGPLGRGFRSTTGRPLLVAGGIGIAPLLFLARRLRVEGEEPVLLYGAGEASSLVARERFEGLGVGMKLATEDGSLGFRGTCVELLESEMKGADYGAVCGCGPSPMLAAVSDLCVKRGVESCQLSIEERMACGVGACLGCSVGSRTGGYLSVCKDGPVFEAGEVAL